MQYFRNLPKYTVTYPDGRTMSDLRTGHTVSGLLHYLDPFQRQHHTRLARVARELP